MAWTTPATQTTGTGITETMYNDDINNMAHLGSMTREGVALSALAASAEIGLRDGARYYRTAVQSIPDVTWTTLIPTASRFEVGTSNASGVITLTLAGRWIFGGCTVWATSTGTSRILRFLLNGATNLAQTDPGATLTKNLTSIYDFAASDTITCQVYQNSGGAVNLNVNANYSPEFWMYRLGS